MCVVVSYSFFVFKQKTAYELRISDWISDVCSSDLNRAEVITAILAGPPRQRPATAVPRFMKKPPAPDRSRKAPKIMKGKTKVAKVAVTTPNRAEASRVGKECVRTCRSRW